ncbi:VOC family protein [Colwellia sp. 12G3]|uniref:VOC family protein n=1 Tax=Colwellia sp. 12G3 TaxID=2058299 RepID=UPI000C34F950|nr:VOC family protein [Colwellia sp. 12G3]PKI15963.1 glyoxalase [Colwellia sp. 12G3]
MSADKYKFSNMLLSHVELYIQDVISMEKFYTEYLGFVVTDRGQGPNGMIFLSRNPKEHHQIVLNPQQSHRSIESPVDHISFRVESISDLRGFNSALKLAADTSIQTVSHGSAWSIYFRDPEGNRFEIFTDTPWYVNQPCKFPVNLEQTDEELKQFTEEKIKDMAGFCIAKEWQTLHQVNLEH